MLSTLKADLAGRVAARIHELHGLAVDPIVEIPPSRDLGDLSFPVALKLAREIKRSPREIGTELADGLELPPGVRELKVQGAGYLNFYLDRPLSWSTSRTFAISASPNSFMGGSRMNGFIGGFWAGGRIT
jgi:arginyl-tRNA synthetase